MYVILIKNKKINISNVKKTYNIIFIFLDISFLIIYIMNSIVVVWNSMVKNKNVIANSIFPGVNPVFIMSRELIILRISVVSIKKYL